MGRSGGRRTVGGVLDVSDASWVKAWAMYREPIEGWGLGFEGQSAARDYG